MVSLTLTSSMIEAIKYLENSGEKGLNVTCNDSRPLLKDSSVGKPISHGQIIAISKSLRNLKQSSDTAGSSNVPSHTLDDLLRGSRIYIEPPKPKAEPTSEYKALMARLHRDEEDRAYERMINPPLQMETVSQRFPSAHSANLFPETQADIGDDDEISYADVNRQMTLIINILISIVACSVAIWLAARHWSTPSRLGLSMGGSGMIGVAEIVVYTGYLRKVKEARNKGKKEIEIKQIIKTWVIGRGEEEKVAEAESIPIASKPSNNEAARRRKATTK